MSTTQQQNSPTIKQKKWSDFGQDDRSGAYTQIIWNNLPGERRVVDWKRENRAINLVLYIQRRENFEIQTLSSLGYKQLLSPTLTP